MSSQQQGGYPAGGPYGPPQAAPRERNTLSIIAIVLGVLAVLVAPIIIGVIGIILGAVAKSKGERLSTWGLIVPIVGTVLGIILGIIVYNNMVA